MVALSSIFLLIFLININSIESDVANPCLISPDVSYPIALLLCNIELGNIKIWHNSTIIKKYSENNICLIGKAARCSTESPMKAPVEGELGVSEIPPESKNKFYQKLALEAESIIPESWWRKSFSNPKLLLSNDPKTDLPKIIFDSTIKNNRKFKQLVQCVSRQQFIRSPYTTPLVLPSESPCSIKDNESIKIFYEEWMKYVDTFDKQFDLLQYVPKDKSILVKSANNVLDYFYSNYGGIWTGCFKMKESIDCRLSLASASLVVSINLLNSIVNLENNSDNSLLEGYFLATLGRSILHGDSGTTGNDNSNYWKVKLADFTALQQIYLKLYIDSIGKSYTRQLNTHIPLSFEPPLNVVTKGPNKWSEYSTKLEPIYSNLRNMMYTEAGNLIDFGPYRPLVAENEARRNVMKNSKLNGGRRILIDVGANGFFASPKYLLDSYAVYTPFTHAIMIEPEPHFVASVPDAYMKRYNITFLQIYCEVNTGSDVDIVKLLPKYVTKDDFVVLKFDVDPNRYAQGPTMEWGFIYSLMLSNQNTASLIDELYIETHFHYPALYWYHYHSNWEALDMFRYLRKQGLIVHSWP